MWEKGSDTVFRKLIFKILKLKLLSSGIPKEYDTDAKKLQYVAEVNELLGTTLEIENFIKNPSLRQISKILINGTWGR